MSSDNTQAVVNEIADIMRRVGKRDEIVENIAENVDFGDLVAAQLKVDGPVKEMAIKAVVQYLKGYEIDNESDEATAILEAIDFSKFMPILLQSKDFQEVVSSAITTAIEDGNIDVSEQVAEAIGDKDFQKVFESEEVKETISKKLKDYVEEFDMTNLSEDTVAELDKVIFDPERIEACLKNDPDLVNQTVLTQVTAYLEDMDTNSGEDNPIAKCVTESKTFQTAVDKAIDELIDSGKVTRLVEKVAADMLSGDNSTLREQLTQAISDQLVKRIAGSIVAQAFK